SAPAGKPWARTRSEIVTTGMMPGRAAFPGERKPISPSAAFPGERSAGPERRHDEAPVGLVALGVRLDGRVAREVLVDDLPLVGAHRLELHRAAEGERILDGAVRGALERRLPPLAIAGRIHDDALPLGRRLAEERGAERE